MLGVLTRTDYGILLCYIIWVCYHIILGLLSLLVFRLGIETSSMRRSAKAMIRSCNTLWRTTCILQPFVMMSYKVKCPGILNHPSTVTFIFQLPRKKSLPFKAILWRRRKVCVDCVPHFCVCWHHFCLTQHTVIFCDYKQTYYSLSNCVYTVFQFCTVWQI